MPVGACHVLTLTMIPLIICHPCVAGTYFSLGLCIAHPLSCNKSARRESWGEGMSHGMASSPPAPPRFRRRSNVFCGNAHTGGAFVAIRDRCARSVPCYQLHCGPPTPHQSSITTTAVVFTAQLLSSNSDRSWHACYVGQSDR